MCHGENEIPTREEYLKQLIDELDFLLPAINAIDSVAAYTLALSILSLQNKIASSGSNCEKATLKSRTTR